MKNEKNKEKRKKEKKSGKKKKNPQKTKKEKMGAETTKMDHPRMYTLVKKILESRPQMCGFLVSKVPFLDVIIPWKIRRAAL